MSWQLIGTAIVVAAEIATLMRALLRPHRDPASRLAWVIAILVLPIAGILLYLLLGETRISPRRRALGREIDTQLPKPPGDGPAAHSLLSGAHWAPFALARSVNCLDPTCGNSARLAPDANAAIDEMIADVDDARQHVHGCFYIWLADNNGLKLKDAFFRAARRCSPVAGGRIGLAAVHPFATLARVA